MLTLAWPWMLLLLPAPLLVRFLLKPIEQQQPALTSALYANLAAEDSAAGKADRAWSKLLLLSLFWLCLVVAASRPQWIGDPISLPASGRDLLLAVDFSLSMDEADMILNNEAYRRVDVVKSVVGDFLQHRQGDRVGLVVFAENAYLHAPLTFDHATVKALLQEMQLGFAGRATAIGDAIGIAIKRLEKRPENSRVVILLSDGADTASELSPQKAAELAAQYNVKIYTVGLGADTIVKQGWFGNRRVNPSRDLDEETLKTIAETTGGQYFRARDPQELQSIYATLDALEPIDQEEEIIRPTKSLFFWPLSGALACFLLALISTALRTDND